MKNYDAIIVGAGFAGAVMAERFAQAEKQVLLIEKRDHIGGNMYDTVDTNGVLVHQYGPHLFHTNDTEVVEYLSQFTEWYPYEHRVKGYIDGKIVPIPFNLTSLETVFPKEKAALLKQELINAFGMEKKVPILELRKHQNPDVKELAEFIYEKVFKYYTMKQWDYTPEEIDPKVTERVPVFLSYDDRYFQDRYQMMPVEGYTALFKRMLAHPNITVSLSTEATDVLRFEQETGKIYYHDQEFTGKVIFTGLVDQLLKNQYGKLQYRSLYFDVQKHHGTYQCATTVNYPTPASVHPYTRITEFKQMMKEQPQDTTITIEYPYRYDDQAEKGTIPYYPVFTEENNKAYQQYVNQLKVFPQLILLGRLAEFRYYNMDAIVKAALVLADSLLEKKA